MSSVTTPPRQRSVLGTLLAGVIGGLVVAVLGAVLIATDVIETGDDDSGSEGRAISQAAADRGEGDRGVQEVFRDVGPGVVFITARGTTNESPFGPQQDGTATGSGFVVDREGHILTADHVVEGSEDVSVKFTDDGEGVDAEVKGRDPSTDLALLKVDPDDAKLDPVPLGDSKNVRVGDPVAAIGDPFGVGRTITTGIVSAVQRSIRAPNGFSITDAIQTDASINPGNSGGPLLDAQGRAIGINSQIATGGGRGSVGIGFAVPVDTAKEIIPELKRSGEVKRPFIGIRTGPVTDEISDRVGVPVDEGALVVDVQEGSPADELDLRPAPVDPLGQPTGPGDVIVRVDGRRIRKPEDINEALRGKRPGAEIPIEYYRRDERRRGRLELGAQPDSGFQGAQPESGPESLIP